MIAVLQLGYTRDFSRGPGITVAIIIEWQILKSMTTYENGQILPFNLTLKAKAQIDEQSASNDSQPVHGHGHWEQALQCGFHTDHRISSSCVRQERPLPGALDCVEE